MLTSGRHRADDQGAVAVEFALLLIPLLLIIFGIIDFGRALNTQITLTQAVREGARVGALGGTSSEMKSAVTRAAIGISTPTVPATATCSPNPAPTAQASIKAQSTYSMITPLGAIMALIPGGGGVGGSFTITGTAVMRCGG